MHIHIVYIFIWIYINASSPNSNDWRRLNVQQQKKWKRSTTLYWFFIFFPPICFYHFVHFALLSLSITIYIHLFRLLSFISRGLFIPETKGGGERKYGKHKKNEWLIYLTECVYIHKDTLDNNKIWENEWWTFYLCTQLLLYSSLTISNASGLTIIHRFLFELSFLQSTVKIVAAVSFGNLCFLFHLENDIAIWRM